MKKRSCGIIGSVLLFGFQNQQKNKQFTGGNFSLLYFFIAKNNDF